MGKIQIIVQFTKGIIRKVRKNEVNPQQIASTLITAAFTSHFVNESCTSSGQISKSQVIYRKLEGKSVQDIHTWFQHSTKGFLHHLKQCSRNRLFILSFDTTKEAFYGNVSKAKDKMYIFIRDLLQKDLSIIMSISPLLLQVLLLQNTSLMALWYQ